MTRRVLITTPWITAGGEVATQLSAAGFEVAHDSASRDSGRLAGFDAVIGGTEPFTAAELEAANALRLLVRTGVGYDNVDVEVASRRGISVGITPGSNRISVAEHVLALMLSCARKIPQSVAAVGEGRWIQQSGTELHGATLGIIGLGSIGKTVARMAAALQMSVIAYDPYLDEAFLEESGVKGATLDELLAQSDFVTLHIFLDQSTRHLIGDRSLRLMKDSAYLINTSRGGVVDEEALGVALREGRLGGAALDVLETEPLPADSPLRAVPDLIITPHTAGATAEARARSGQIAAQSIIDFFAGTPVPGIVNSQLIHDITAGSSR